MKLRLTINDTSCKVIISAVLALLMFTQLQASPYAIRVLNTVYPSLSEEQKCMLIDKEGMLWLGSNFGIKSYDGYRFKSYRSDATSPNILPNNNVLSLTEGKDETIWIGTRNGLVCMNKKTGKFCYPQSSRNRQPCHLFTLYIP